MIGVIRVRGESVFVEYTAAQYTRPQRVVMLWRVCSVARCPYSPRWPQEGDEVTSGDSSDVWSGRGYSVSFPGDAQAEETRTEEIPPPRVRAGTETRWARGQWGEAHGQGMGGRMMRLARRLWICWRTATLAAVDAWCDAWARAWLGREPVRRLRGYEIVSEEIVRPVSAHVPRTEPAQPPPAPPQRVNGATLAQPRMDEAAIVGGLRGLGVRNKDVALRAAQKALQSGDTDASGLMRRALAALTDGTK